MLSQVLLSASLAEALYSIACYTRLLRFTDLIERSIKGVVCSLEKKYRM
jgi:hypothetical protein